MSLLRVRRIKIKNITSTNTGTLRQLFKKVKRNSIQHSEEIMKLRLSDKSLGKKWFFTADFPMYTIEDDNGRILAKEEVQKNKGEYYIYLARNENNLAFDDINDSVSQIKKFDVFFPQKKQISKIIESIKKTTLKIRLKDLNLKNYDDSWSYFEIDTKNYQNLNKEQRKFVERIYGFGEYFIKSMNMLLEMEISKTRIYTLSDNYIKKKILHKKCNGAIARVSWLYTFYCFCVFGAVGRGIDKGGRLLGEKQLN